NTAVLGMPPAQAGVAAAVASTSRQVGQTLGVAVVGAIAAAGAFAIGPGFVAASHTCWWIIAGCGLAALLLGFISTTGWANASARRASDELGGGDAGGALEVEPARAGGLGGVGQAGRCQGAGGAGGPGRVLVGGVSHRCREATASEALAPVVATGRGADACSLLEGPLRVDSAPS